MPNDYYEILGVSRDATPEEIKRAYRRLARQHHPDVNQGDQEAEERFKQLGEAYAVLSDPEARRRYDLYGAGGPSDFGFSNGFPDIFEIFNEAFGFGGGRRAAAGRDLQLEVSIQLEEVLTGATREVEVQRRVACATCNGTGAKPGSTPVTCSTCQGAGRVRQMHSSLFGNMVTVAACPQCHGRGTVIKDRCEDCRGTGIGTATETLKVDIPPGIESGQHLEYEGYGDLGEGGYPGNLYVRVTVETHPEFARDGSHVRSTVPISFWQAALGDKLTVRILEGEASVNLPAGTQSGEEIRLPGKGLPVLRRRGRGDHIVTLRVVTPQDLTHRQKQALEDLARAFGDEVPAGHDKGLFARFRETLTGE